MSDRDLLTAAGRLKRVKRQGWLDAGIPEGEAESVADHSFRVALIAAFISPAAGVDVLKMVKMALLHDLAEHTVGDITPRSGVSRVKKANMEEQAIRDLGDEGLLLLWKEYDRGISREAKLVQEADVLERVVQAKEYAARGTGKGLACFWKGCGRRVRSARYRALL